MAWRLVWVMVIGIPLVLGSAFTNAAQQSPSTVEAKDDPAADIAPASAEPPRLWLTTNDSGDAGDAVLAVQYPEEPAPGAEIEFLCEIRSKHEIGDITITLTIANKNGELIADAENALLIREGVNPCRFLWTPNPTLSDGRYIARLEVVRAPSTVVAWNEIEIRKLSRSLLQERLTDTKRIVSEINDHVLSNPSSAYAKMRAAIASDILPFAQSALDAGDWRHADDLADYAFRTADSIRARITFASIAPGLDAKTPPPSLAGLSVHDGAYYAGDRPVFLFGITGTAQPPEPEKIARYGLNLATVALGPDSPFAHDAKALAELFEQAAAANVAVFCNVLPQSGAQDNLLDLASSSVFQSAEKHIANMMPFLASQSMLAGVSVADQPYLSFNSETVRNGFQDYLREKYTDRFSMNRSWNESLRSFDVVEIGWDNYGPAYEYDWQLYHQILATNCLTQLLETARAKAPNAPLQVTFRGDMFDSFAIRGASDIEDPKMKSLASVVGCATETRPDDPVYAMSYPQQFLVYSFLRSINPDKPVFDASNELFACTGPSGNCGFNYAYAAMWEAAMAGLSASALRVDESDPFNCLLARPECLEGYASAGLDLNRLADVIAAFQQSAADIGILVSVPSIIFEGGEIHLSSLKRAYEGCSCAGWKVRFITDRQCLEGALDNIKVLVVPDTPSIGEETFRTLDEFAQAGSPIIRGSTPFLRDKWGHSRRDFLTMNMNTIFIEDDDSPTQYLHAIDAMNATTLLPAVPRPINQFGYPLEGVKTQFLEFNGKAYLYAINLRKETVQCHLAGAYHAGTDLISGQRVSFPRELASLNPMLIELDPIHAPKVEEKGEAAIPTATAR